MGGLKKILVTAPKSLASYPEIQLPASKSISNRALVIQSLAKVDITIKNLSQAEDTVLMKAALSSKGHNVLEDGSHALWLGEAGTALRFGLAWAAITEGTRILEGSDRLCHRPIADLVDALRSLGAEINYKKNRGFAPLKVVGKNMSGGTVAMDGSKSSQYVTALLLIAPYLQSGLKIELAADQVSMPYIAMTVQLMQAAGAKVRLAKNTITVKPGEYIADTITVEPDWSAASYFYTWVLLNPGLSISLKNLPSQSLQGDSFSATLFNDFGVQTTFSESGASLVRQDDKDGKSHYNFVDCPDLAQTFAAAAAGLKKPCKLTGLQTLKIKETDRIAAMAAELRRCGVSCEAGEDYLELLSFSKPLSTPVISTYNDHRMAMSFAPLASVFGRIIIEDPEVVAKSFPTYWDEVAKMGYLLKFL